MTILVEGLLYGGGGARNSDAGLLLVLYLQPWRVLKGEVVLDRLRLEIPASQEQFRHAKKTYADGMGVRVTVEALERGTDWWTAAAPRDLKRSKPSAAVVAAAAASAPPAEIRDAVLGTLTYQRRFSWYTGQCRIAGRPIELSVERTRDELAVDLARAGTTYRAVARNLSAIRKSMVRYLLPLYNDTWRDDRARLTGVGLLRRVTPSSMVITPGGRTTFYWNDGGLFHEHAIEVRLSARGAVKEILLAG
jgi:hypothetical protein